MFAFPPLPAVAMSLTAAGALLQPAVSPAPQQQPGDQPPPPRESIQAQTDEPAAPSLLPEGAFVVEQIATLRRTENNQWVFVFENAPLPPMLAMPSLNLMAMRRLTENQRGASHRFVVSGEVFVHRGRNYLLVTRFASAPFRKDAAEDDAAAQDASSQQQPRESAPPEKAEAALPSPVDATEEPSVAELIEALERATPAADVDRLARAAQRSVPAEEHNAQGLLREGTLLANRAGRIVRDSAGVFRFLVDTDVDSAQAAEPPMKLAPSLTSMALEAAVEALGGDAAAIVSGRVLLYEGENYLLPTYFHLRRLPAGDLTSAQ